MKKNKYLFREIERRIGDLFRELEKENNEITENYYPQNNCRCKDVVFSGSMVLQCRKPMGHKGCHFAMIDVERRRETKEYLVDKFKIPVNW